MRRVAIAFLLLVSLAPAARAEDAPSRDRYRIHVITVEPGDDLFSRWGHIALMVEDRAHQTKKVYNWGTFDFLDPSLRIRYVKGLLFYWLSVSTYAAEIRRFEFFDRDLYLRTLDLTPAQAAEVAERVEANALPENREYRYRHYWDNCCTRIRDVLDDVLDGAISRGRSSGHSERTFRYWTRRALQGLPVSRAFILFSLGSPVDQPISRWHEEFVPEVLSTDLDEVRLAPDNRPLVKQKSRVVSRQGPHVGVSSDATELAVASVFFGLLALGFCGGVLLGQRSAGRRLAGLGLAVYGLVTGLGGTVLVLFLFTEHTDTHYNENVLVAPFLNLWLLGPGLKLLFTGRLGERTSRVLAWYLVCACGLLVLDLALGLGPFVQDNGAFIAFAAAGNALALGALVRSRLTGAWPRRQQGGAAEAKPLPRVVGPEKQKKRGGRQR